VGERKCSLEVVEMIDKNFWKNKKVFITGHTGFKGAWLCLLLSYLKAHITGYSLPPPTRPSLFKLCKTGKLVKSNRGDIRNGALLNKAINQAEPEIIIHMAAQALVRESYKNPPETYEVNIMGTVNLFEAIRTCKSIKAVINVTTDKCYENKEWCWPYRENEHLGGHDPYSASKACSEIITSSYGKSFFNSVDNVNRVSIASARSGNVIGGGDWGQDRLIPDCIKALLKEEKIIIRNPGAIRPWQHVIEPLTGYLLLAEKLYEKGPDFSEPWNFGPDTGNDKTVEWMVKTLCEKWGKRSTYEIDKRNHPHEAHYLKLDTSKAKSRLGWSPRWSPDYALDKTIEWTEAYKEKRDLREVSLRQIEEYLKL
jgi:CDP-glucose 4,6-dehydratase